MNDEDRPILDEQERKQKTQKPAQEKQPKPSEAGVGDRDLVGNEKKAK